MAGRRGIFGILLLVLLSVLSWASAQDSPDLSVSVSGSVSTSESDVDISNQNPCSFRGTFLLHKQSTRLDPCTVCTCFNGTTTCNIESCPSEAGCEADEIVVIPEECCPQCPYKMFVDQTTNMYDQTFEFSEGDSKSVKFNLDIAVDRKLTSRIVRGENLWKLSAWISSNEDGSGRQYSFEDNVFTENQAAQEYSKPTYPPWVWNKLKYTMNFKGGTCPDYKFFCVKFDQADDPRPTYDLSFSFQPVDDEEQRLIDCVPLGECKALTATNLDWELTEVDDPVYGQDTAISLNVDVDFTPDSPRKRQGEGLWRVGIFGSENPDGDGARFAEVRQTLNENKASTTKKGVSLKIDEISSEFQLGTIGWGDVQYVCVEFARGDSPDPDFTMTVDTGRGDTSSDTLIICKEQGHSATFTATSLDWELTEVDDPLYGQDTAINLNIDVDFTPDSPRKLQGEGLWRVGIFGSENPDGDGTRFAEVRQTLNENKASTPKKGPSLKIDEISSECPLFFQLYITAIGCGDVQYVCVEFARGDSPDPDFTMTVDTGRGDTSSDTLITCKEQGRSATFTAISLDWELTEVDDPLYGQDTAINLNIDVDFTPDSPRKLQGEGLWRVGIFGSENPDGDGTRFAEVRQTLNENKASTPKKGPSLKIDEISSECPLFFQLYITAIGCGDVQYVCVEFARGDSPDPDFAMAVDTGRGDISSDTLITCKEQGRSARVYPFS